MEKRYPEQWNVTCSREHFERLRSDVGFQRLVALMRIVNELRFSQLTLPAVKGDDTPSGKRQRINSFLLTGAILFEGMQLAQRLAQTYRDRESFKKGFSELLRDTQVLDLLSVHLKPLRNQAVFHVDDKRIQDLLSQYSADEVVLISGIGTKSGYTYYDIGDIIAMMALIGPCNLSSEFLQRSETLIKRTTALAIDFLSAADKLIAEILKESNLEIQPSSDSKPLSD